MDNKVSISSFTKNLRFIILVCVFSLQFLALNTYRVCKNIALQTLQNANDFARLSRPLLTSLFITITNSYAFLLQPFCSPCVFGV